MNSCRKVNFESLQSVQNGAYRIRSVETHLAQEQKDRPHTYKHILNLKFAITRVEVFTTQASHPEIINMNPETEYVIGRLEPGPPP